MVFSLFGCERYASSSVFRPRPCYDPGRVLPFVLSADSTFSDEIGPASEFVLHAQSVIFLLICVLVSPGNAKGELVRS